jgi:formamidopyrimidine-DNA glycosylase
MFELPEYITLAGQMNATMKGKTIRNGRLGAAPHKFVWYNRSHAEFSELTAGKTVGAARVRGRWLFLPLEPGYVLLLGECGGKILYHPPGARVPTKYHLYLTFTDDAFFTATTQMWGAMELYAAGAEQEREYVKDMRPTPVEPAFSFDYFSALIDALVAGKKRSVKSLLTQDQLIPGLGNAIAQDIMFHARLHPRYPIADLSPDQRRALYDAICSTVEAVIAQGGRYDEVDLHNQRGGYVRLMDKNAAGRPCPACGTAVQKMSYLGGTCYFCPRCQEDGAT